MIHYRIFVASSVVYFRQARQKLARYIDKLNGKTVEEGFVCKLFLCEHASNTVQEKGMQAFYNEEIPNLDIFLLLADSRYPVGKYTQQEARIAAALPEGQPRQVLVGVRSEGQPLATPRLPQEVSCLAQKNAECVGFALNDLRPLYAALEERLCRLDNRYREILGLNEKKSQAELCK